MLTDTRTCQLCEEVQVPLSEFYCERCFSIIEIGIMMRKLPDFNAPVNVQYMPPLGWRIIVYKTGDAQDSGNYVAKLEQALLALGLNILNE